MSKFLLFSKNINSIFYAYFLFKTKFGNIAAAVNQTEGDLVLTLVRAARGGFDAEGGEEEEAAEYYEEEQQEEPAEPPVA